MNAVIAPEFRTGTGGEGAHWYKPGNPVECIYEIRGKNGNFRPVRKTDARTHGLVPGVSSITSLVAQPGLERWKRQQSVLAALTHPAAATVTDTNALLAMIEKDSQEQVRKAAEKGTAIHKAIETWFADRTKPVADEFWPYVRTVIQVLEQLTGTNDLTFDRADFRTETAATHPLGYGGRTDLFSTKHAMVIDLKGKEFGPDWKPEAYPEQAMQLAAYERLVKPIVGVSNHYTPWRCINLFISRNVPGLVKAYEWEPSDIEKAWRKFKHLLAFWREANDFS